MKKITLLLPYFGNAFPNTFPLLLDSMYKNDKINFIVFTNIETKKLDREQRNVEFIHTDLKKIREQASDIVGFNVNLYEPYKLCDFRPLYGLIFKKYLNESDWWGHFDSDIIFGNLNSFVESTVFDHYEKVFTGGPLTFYKNTDRVNNLCLSNFDIKGVPSYRDVFSSSASFGYDEWGKGKNRGRGISWIIDHTSIISQYSNKKLYADILPNQPGFIMDHGVVNDSELNVGEKIRYFKYGIDGSLNGIDFNNKKYEYIFAHFQKRNLLNDVVQTNNAYKDIYIYPNFISNKYIPDYRMSLDDIKTWRKEFQKRKIKHFWSHLTIDNLKLRVKFINQEK